jgi:hypothetical protein
MQTIAYGVTMSRTNKSRRKLPSKDGGFLTVPKTVLRHPNYILLSPHARMLLLDLGEQFIGLNNGDLCATWSMMRERGWRSKETLNNARKELMYYEFIVQTQYGGLNKPTLYALSWIKVHKAKSETGLKSGDSVSGWTQTKRKYKKSSTHERKDREKRQVRLTGQSGTASGTVSGKLKVIK